jgi:hypothetical protein
MTYFHLFNPLVDIATQWPFGRLWEIQNDSVGYLSGNSLEELRAVATEISELVKNERALYNAERAAQDPKTWGYLNELEETYAFFGAYNAGRIPVKEWPWNQPRRCMAVLALMKLEDALRSMRWRRVRPTQGLIPRQIIGAEIIAGANALLEAQAALTFCARTAAIEAYVTDPEKVGWLVKDELTKRAKHAALLAHQPMALAREFVTAEWAAHKAQYDNNKSAFARTYVKLVAAKFKDRSGDPLMVTEKTIRESWLASTPAARRPAGVPAAGE